MALLQRTTRLAPQWAVLQCEAPDMNSCVVVVIIVVVVVQAVPAQENH